MSSEFSPQQFLRPQTVEETLSLLMKYGARSRIIAGGTGIYETAHRGLLAETEVLIDLSGVGLTEILLDPKSSTLRIGASVTMSSLALSEPILREPSLAALKDAIKAIQPLQVKNVATICGAVCTGLPFFDLPVAIMSVGAAVEIEPGRRAEKVANFIQGYFTVGLAPGEIVTAINIPIPSNNKKRTASAFEKFALTGDDWALVNCAALVTLDSSKGESKIEQCVLAFGGGVGDRPILATKTAQVLEGIKVNDDLAVKRAIEESVPNDLEPISDIRASGVYRMKIAKVIARRTVVEAVKRATHEVK